MSTIDLEKLDKLPLLQYYKAPVEKLYDLYQRYPDGGEFGWFAFVYDFKTFAYWNTDEKEWKLLNNWIVEVSDLPQVVNDLLNKSIFTIEEDEEGEGNAYTSLTAETNKVKLKKEKRFSEVGHSHVVNDVDNLQNDLDSKSGIEHKHKFSELEEVPALASFDIRKTYASISLMNADSTNPIGDNGNAIQKGEIVTVVNNTTPSENGFYSYTGTGWLLQSGFNFQVEQVRSQNTNTAPSSKLFDDTITGMNAVSYNAQAKTDAEKLQARNNIGAENVEQVRSQSTNSAPSSKLFDDEITPLHPSKQLTIVSNNEFLFAIVDTNNAILFGIQKDGNIILNSNKIDDINDLITEINSSITQLIPAKQFTVVSNNEFLFTVVDVNNMILFGIQKDGNIIFNSNKIDDINASINQLSPAKQLSIVSNNEFLFAIVDTNSSILFGIQRDGNVVLNNDKISQISELTDKINQIGEIVDDSNNYNSFDFNLGSINAGGSLETELSATALSGQSILLDKSKTIERNLVKKYNSKRIAVACHDDLQASDFISTRRLLNKYNFNSTFNWFLWPFSSIADRDLQTEEIRKLLLDGNTLGLHAIMHESNWLYNREYDVRPDSTSTFSPTLSELTDSGNGKNSLGQTITPTTKFSELGFKTLPANFNKTVSSATQTDWFNVVSYYSMFYRTNQVTGLDLDENVVNKVIYLGWLEYWYNKLIDSSMGYSTTSGTLLQRFQADYDIPVGVDKTLNNLLLYYPDYSHLKTGKIEFFDKITQTQIDAGYQSVGRFNKGLFKGCASTLNAEITDVIVRVATEVARYYFGIKNFVYGGIHGQAYSNCSWYLNNLPYADRDKTLLRFDTTKYYNSKNGCWESLSDVFLKNGVKISKTLWSSNSGSFNEGMTGLYFGQNGIRSNLLFAEPKAPRGLSYQKAYIHFFLETGDVNQQTDYSQIYDFLSKQDNWGGFLYDNANKSVTSNSGIVRTLSDSFQRLIEIITATLETGKVPVFLFDTIQDSAGMKVIQELFYRFCYLNDITIVDIETARNLCVGNSREFKNNYFPNPTFKQSIKNLLHTESIRGNLPDGFYIETGNPTEMSISKEQITIGEQIYNAKILKMAGSAISSRIYGLPAGKYRFSALTKTESGDSTINIALKKNSDGEMNNGIYPTFDKETVVIDNLDWAEKIYDFEIPEFEQELTDDILSVMTNGYQNNVSNIYINFDAQNSNIYLSNIKISKI